MLDLYRTFHPTAAEYTFFSSVHGTCSSIDHVLAHKTSLNKFRKIEIIMIIFSEHNGIKLEVNYKKKSGKIINMWRLNNILLNNYGVTKEIKGEIKKYLKTNENENMTYQILRDAAKAILRGKFTTIQAYLKKQEKSQII